MAVIIRSLGLQGINGYEVTVECALSGGLPAFDIVGLPDAAVKESRERVRAAIRSLGARFPVSRVTINLAPAALRKEGTLYDLPILLGLLAAGNDLPALPTDAAFIGELSLTGTLRPVKGVLPMAMAAVRAGIRSLYLPADNAAEATLVEGLTVYPVSDLLVLYDHLTGRLPLPPAKPWKPSAASAQPELDFSQVMGQENVKRALEIAAAGQHNILLVGAPGSGKSMLARRLPSILPDMTNQEALEATEVWSVAGLTDRAHPLLLRRPFRAPHHTLSAAAMVGGGSLPGPGEVSLAHHGVLFLDELPEFQRPVLEVLRQPIEEGEVTITRVAGTIRLPSRFMLVCAMNPCPCGWHGHPTHRCRCSSNQVAGYARRISGPMLDRMDIYIEVPPVEFDDMRRTATPESSAVIRERVNAARSVQIQRFQGTGVTCNAHMTPDMVGRFCQLDAQGERLLRRAFNNLGLTARSHDRILRVARTIADLAASPAITPGHLAEALQYRNVDILKDT